MKIAFAPRGIVQMDNAVIMWRNFAGKAEKYNREGDRHFTIKIDDEKIADELLADGWNVKIDPNDIEGEPPYMSLKVKVKFNEWGPRVCLISNGRRIMLDEDTVGELDRIQIDNVNLDIRPFDWEVNGKTGRTAYLQTIEVTQRVDRFAARWAEMDNDVPFNM